MIIYKLYYKYFVLIMRLLLGIIFIISGLSRFININEFASIVQNFNLLPYKIIPYFSMFLAVFEYLVGIALIIGFYPRHSGFLSGLMFLVFIFAISWNLLHGNITQCGCFDMIHKGNVSIEHLIIDLILLCFSVLVVISREHVFTLSGYLTDIEENDIKFPGFQKCSYFKTIIIIFLIAFITIVLALPRPKVRSPEELKRLKSFIINEKNYAEHLKKNIETIAYGQQISDFLFTTFNGKMISSKNLMGTVNIFLVFTPKSLATIDATIAYADSLLKKYSDRPLRVFLLYQFPYKVKENIWPEIIETLKERSYIDVFLDKDLTISTKLKIPMTQSCGGYVLIADKHNICRLSIRAVPNEIIHEIVERYIDKE